MGLNSTRFWIAVAGLSGIAAVLAGAYGWHDLEADTTKREIFSTAVQYHMWHTLALLGVAWLTDRRSEASARWASKAGWFFIAGIVLFSGSLYSFSITGELPISGAAPIGGLLFISGWAMLAWSAMRRDSSEETDNPGGAADE